MVSPVGPRDLATRVFNLGRGAPWLCARCLRDGAELAWRPLSSCPARDTQKPPLYVVARLIPIHGLGSLQRQLACTSLAQHRQEQEQELRGHQEQGRAGPQQLTRNNREVRVAPIHLYTSTLLPLGLYLSLYTGFTQALHKLYLWVYCCPISLPLPNPYL